MFTIATRSSVAGFGDEVGLAEPRLRTVIGVRAAGYDDEDDDEDEDDEDSYDDPEDGEDGDEEEDSEDDDFDDDFIFES